MGSYVGLGFGLWGSGSTWRFMVRYYKWGYKSPSGPLVWVVIIVRLLKLHF